MKHYRINKLTRLDGLIVKKSDVLGTDDRAAIARAAASDDCPVCEVVRDGKVVGVIR